MKNYEETAHDVLLRIETERKVKKRRRIRIALSGVSMLCICLAVVVCFNFLGGGTAQMIRAADLMDGITTAEVDGRKTDDRFTANQMRLALELFQRTSAGSEGRNLLISPLSIQLALAMTANGAGGETLEEMERVLGGDISIDELNEYLYTYADSLPSEEKVKLEIANSIWFRDTFDVRKEFLQKNADYYGAAAYRSAFDDETVKDINNWVSKNTDGMIDKIIEEIDPLTVMFLINAIVFDGKWEKTYDEDDVSDEVFYSYSGGEQDAELMYSMESVYLDDGSATGFIKPYAGGKYSFAALLPNEGTDIYDYIAGLTPEGLTETLENAESADVHAYLPKFSYEYEKSLNAILSDMGMPTAFTEGAADLSGIGDGRLFIGGVQHKTFISVDENGTKAAAVTPVEVTTESCPSSYTVYLDRPFIYMIVDRETNLPVFIGTVTEISK
ncbi:MAG: serine protease [Ruminococcaceae bacterium]|nr:serine protease [Oscillospiraceae bacterium]